MRPAPAAGGRGDPSPPHRPSCSSCASPAVAFTPYNGRHHCARHLVGFVRRRFRTELRRQVRLSGAGTVAVAVSGGKDSLLLLRLAHEVVAPRRDTRLIAITVDEGIAGYREYSLPFARDTCAELGVHHIVVRFADLFGRTLDEIVPVAGVGPCTACGVLRRRALNATARKAGASVLLTGHNLDDCAQTILMNHLQGDPMRLLRLPPHDDPRPGLVPRAVPLRTIPEKECTLAMILQGWPYHDGECPYAAKAGRGPVLEALYRLEEAAPGTRHALLKGSERLRPILRAFAVGEGGTCPLCGEPSGGGVCRSCALLRRLTSGG